MLKFTNKNLKKQYPWLLFLFITFLFFYQFIFLGKAFIPSDILYLDSPWQYQRQIKKVHNPYLSDVIEQYLPQNIILADALKKGASPLWNPYSLTGTPFLANPTTGAAYPVKLFLYFFFEPITAHGINLMVHLFFMGVGMYLFAKECDLYQFAATVAGVVWMLNGCVMVWLEYEYAATIGCWMPFLFYTAERFRKTQKTSFLLQSGACIGFILLGGFPQLAVYVICLFVVYFLFTNRFNIKLLFLFIPLLGGALVAAVQLLPTSELVGMTQRPNFSYHYVTRYAGVFPVENLITFLIPDYFGNPVDGYYFARGSFFNDAQNYIELTGYCGFFPLFLAGIAVCLKRDKLTCLFAIIALLSVLCAMGTPLHYLFYYLVPGFKKIKAISRILITTAFCISFLSGVGAQILFNSLPQKTIKRILTIGAAIIFIFPIFILASRLIFSEENIKIIGSLGERGLESHFSMTNPMMAFSYLLIVFSFFICLLCMDDKKRRMAKFFGLLLILADLIVFGWRINTVTDRDMIYPPLPSLGELTKKTNPFRIMTIGIRPNSFMPFFIQSAGGYNNLYPEVVFNYADLIEGFTDKNIKHFIYFSKPYISPLIDLWNIEYMVQAKDIPIAQGDVRAKQTENMTIYKNNTVLPRAFVVQNATVIGNEKQMLQYLMSKNFNPKKEVLLFEPVKTDNSPLPFSPHSASITDYSYNRVEIETNTKSDGILVLSDTYYPGWKVTIDKKAGKVLRTNYLFRGVKLHKGQHTVVFEYDPPQYKTGLFISIASLLMILLYCIKEKYCKINCVTV